MRNRTKLIVLFPLVGLLILGMGWIIMVITIPVYPPTITVWGTIGLYISIAGAVMMISGMVMMMLYNRMEEVVK